MFFERQRLLLSLLNTLDEPVSAMDFQNFLFLYTHELESSPSCEFVPYKEVPRLTRWAAGSTLRS